MIAASDQVLPTFPVLKLLYHSASCFASAQFVHEVRNRQLIGVFFSGAFEPRRNTVGKWREDDSLAVVSIPMRQFRGVLRTFVGISPSPRIG
jgi:hypothetical protein